jgi:hypothetical protein
MPQGWFLRAVLAIALGLGVTAGLIRADEALPLPNPVPPNAPVINHSVPSGEPFHHSQDVVLSEWPTVGQGLGHPSSFRERVHNCVTKYLAANVPAVCWAHHNSVGCGNFCSEFNFIFGSCRTFYGETCFRGPPPQPVPVGYWYGQGYPYGSGEYGGCRCP